MISRLMVLENFCEFIYLHLNEDFTECVNVKVISYVLLLMRLIKKFYYRLESKDFAFLFSKEWGSIFRLAFYTYSLIF